MNYPSPDLSHFLGQPFKSIFQINFLNQLFESTYIMNILIKSTAPLACGTSLPRQTYVRRKMYSYLLRYIRFRGLTFLQIAHLLRYEVYHYRAPLSGGVDENLV